MQRLVVAGLHAHGEAAVLEMAARTAAVRKRELTWHGDADLRATSWLDGSGVDRALAAHQGAFVIGARSSLPALLERAGTLSAERVAGASQLDESALLHVTIDDASRYLPALRECAVRALSVSVARTRGEGMRAVLTAQYEAASAAARAGSCLHSSALERATPRLHEWLERAQPLAGSYTTQLRAGVTRAELQQLLEELARIAHGG